MLNKDSSGVNNLDHIREKCFQKIDTGSDAVVRVYDKPEPIIGKIIQVKIDGFVIKIGEKKETIGFDKVLEVE